MSVAPAMRIGLTLPNRGVLLGITTPAELLDLAEIADRSGVLASVWVGDSLLGKPRLEAIALLAAIAFPAVAQARTSQQRSNPQAKPASKASPALDNGRATRCRRA